MQELTALNRAFQAELSRRFSAEKAASLGMGASREERFRRSPTVLLEAERERISVYLEEQVRSRLLVLQYSLDRCRELVHHDPSSALSLLDGIKADLRSVQADHVRRISQELYPSVVKLGLVPSLRSLTDRFQPSVAVELVVAPQADNGGPHPGIRLSEEYRVGIYRIVQEALDNVVKHARASKARVGVRWRRDGRISLEVADDGLGFEVGSAARGFGLMAMTGYAEALAGSCRIESGRGQGARLHVTLPAPDVQREP